MLERSIRLLLTQGGFTVERLLAQLRLAPSDIEALAGLPAGLLSSRRARVAMLPTPRLKTATLRDDPAEVIPLQAPEA